MARVLVLCEDPRWLDPDEGHRWRRRELDAGHDGRLVPSIWPVSGLPQRGGRAYKRLIELNLASAGEAERLSNSRGCALLAELRSLGMRPTVLVVADPAATTLQVEGR